MRDFCTRYSFLSRGVTVLLVLVSAEEAVEKLLQLSQGNSGSHRPPQALTMKSVAQSLNTDQRNLTQQQSGQTRTMNSNHTQHKQQQQQQPNLQLDLKSRLPSVSSTGHSETYLEGGALRILSPRTPGTAISGDLDFPDFPQDQSANASFRTALTALDSYANNSYAYGTGFMNDGGASANYGVWDFELPGGNSAAPPNIPPPPLNDGNYAEAAPNPFSALPGLNNFSIPTSTTNTAVTESSQLFTLPATTSSTSLLRSSSPRTNHNAVFSENSYSSPHRMSSVSSGLTSPFTPLNSMQQPDFNSTVKSSNTAQTPSRQSSSGSNEGSIQPLPASASKDSSSSARFRNYNMSLNATERESLEKLIEEVIIGGVDSEGTTSEEDESSDTKKVKKDSDSSGKEGALAKPKEGKLYGSQMKVAAKHMKNLPPR